MRLTAALLAVLATSANAEDFSGEFDPVAASPFAFAEEGAKAERVAAAEADTSGARVIGGEKAADGAWPWQVGLLLSSRPVGANAHFCGGSMILDRWVLTAAHCIHMADQNGTYRDLAPQALQVIVGTNKIAKGEGDLVPVEAIYVHPDYVGTEFDNDIGLIKLARVPDADYQTIKVPDAELGDMLETPGVRTVVTGWGLTEGGEHPDELRQAEIQMLDRNQCNQALLEARARVAAQGLGQAIRAFGLKEDDAKLIWGELVSRVQPPLTENMVCSGTFEGGKTACSGDSGGPLVVRVNDDNLYLQAGVVSWGLSGEGGKSCYENARFSAYTRTANYVGWLNETISGN